jgi:2-amino-4-hydroxy-6-hydroxymethyldihydropteridine diphosphokinase
MENVYLLLGSNVGKPAENVAKACSLIEANCGKIVHRSTLYKTGAWGITNQADFINQAMQISTAMEPMQLLAALKNIEIEMGRTDTTKWGPRIIDIDILFYGCEVVDTEALKIPHPFLQQRRFALVPMNEIAPAFIHPVLQINIAGLLAICKDESAVKKMEEKNLI